MSTYEPGQSKEMHSTYTSNQGQQNTDTVGKVDGQVEQEHGNGNRQHLFTVGRYRHRECL